MKIHIDRYFLIIPFIVWSSLPVLAYNQYARIIVSISIFAFFFFSLIKVLLKNKIKINWIYTVIPIVIVYMFSTHLYYSKNQFNLWHLQISIYLIFVIVARQIIQDNPKSIMILIVAILLTNLITIILTLHALQIDQNTARAFSRSNDISMEISKSGVGGYSLVYSNLALFPIFFVYLKKLIIKKNKKYFLKTLLFLNIVFASILFIKAQYTLALLIGLSLILFIFVTNIKYKYSIFILSFIMLFLALYHYSDTGNDYMFLKKILEGTRYQEKFNAFINILSGNEISKSIDARLVRYKLSIDTFISNPMTGNLTFDPETIGMHSDFLDKFAQWGIGIGALILFFVLYLPIKICSFASKSENKEFLLFVFVIFFIGLFNTIPLQLSLSLILSACYVSYFQLNVFQYHKYQERSASHSHIEANKAY